MTAETIWSELMAGNRRFATGAPQPRDLVCDRERLRFEQHPKAIVLACSDSRVAPEIIFDQGLGELFVIRSAGNLADKFAIGSIEYAVERAGCPLLIVMGHQRCAAVNAACAGEKFPSPYLAAIVKAVRGSFTAEVADNDQARRRAEQDNARFVARTLLDSSELLHCRVMEGKLAVISAHYCSDTGAVERL